MYTLFDKNYKSLRRLSKILITQATSYQFFNLIRSNFSPILNVRLSGTYTILSCCILHLVGIIVH